jgi:hypothetical protein
MAFVHSYDHDIFVSYAHVDDVPLVEGSGWVSTFVDRLRRLLAMRLGRADAYSIWMDRRLIGNDPFPEALLQQINRSAALVIILSPGYLRSEWCRNERNAFLDTVRSKSYADRRVFIVETWPTERDEWPTEFKDRLVHRFWEESVSDAPRTLGFPAPDATDERYFIRLEGLVRELVALMKMLVESDSGRRVLEVVPSHVPEVACATPS